MCLRFGPLKVSVLSAHAPVEDSPPQVKEEWCEELQRELAAASASSKLVVLCIDANGTLGSNLSAAVGSCRPEPETENGSLLRSILEPLGMSAVNTFAGGEYTYVGTHGHKRRIDYICLPTWCLDFVRRTWVAADLCLAPGAREDHRAVCVDVDLAAAAAYLELEKTVPKLPTKKQLSFEQRSLNDPAARSHFKKLIGQHFVDTTGDIDEETARWTTAVRDAAIQSFKQKAIKRSKPWLDDESLDALHIVRERRVQLNITFRTTTSWNAAAVLRS